MFFPDFTGKPVGFARRRRGFAIGVESHGIATARAFTEGEVAGSFGGLGMVLNAILTADFWDCHEQTKDDEELKAGATPPFIERRNRAKAT